MRVLVVDDDPAVQTAVSRALRHEGYDVQTAGDGAEALEALERSRPDTMVLDVTMPNVDGLEVCRRLRAEGDDLPILVLTARHAVSDRVAGLDAGADDYLVKPFALEELLARVRALLRRTDVTEPAEVLAVGDLRLDPAAHRAERAGTRIDLTRTEFALLELLMRNTPNVVTREVIMARVWGYDFPTSSNSLDVYVSYVRRKTEVNAAARVVHTVRGVGYAARLEP
ncbi:MAG TPA: response regulator transcription factor [Acidimicrobiales bacterium]